MITIIKMTKSVNNLRHSDKNWRQFTAPAYWHGTPIGLLYNSRMPRGQIFRMKQLRSIISTANGVRIAVNVGTPYTTGQSVTKIWLYLDLHRIIERNVTLTTERYGIKRATRFAQWCNGKRINSFWHEHRPKLYQDIDRLRNDINSYINTPWK